MTHSPGTARMRKTCGRLFALVIAAIVTCMPCAANAQDAPLPDLSSVLGDLRKGGYVIFVRHAATEQIKATDEATDLQRCETQRNLSPEGRVQAAEMGKAIKALGIPVGLVQASPFCRTRDTAQLAFGHYTVNKDLLFVISMDANEAKRVGQSLRHMLSTPPRKGTNSVLVSHSANLREAAGIFAKPEGAAYIFKPLPDGSAEAVARVLPEDWANFQQRARSGKPL